MNLIIRNFLIKSFNFIVICLILFAAYRKIGKIDYVNLKNFNLIELIFVTISSIFLWAISTFMLSRAWAIIFTIVDIKTRITHKRLQQIFLLSNLGKYLPGSIFNFISRFFLLNNVGVDKKKFIYIIFVELFTTIAIYVFLIASAIYYILYISDLSLNLTYFKYNFLYDEIRYLHVAIFSFFLIFVYILYKIKNKFSAKLIFIQKLLEGRKKDISKILLLNASVFLFEGIAFIIPIVFLNTQDFSVNLLIYILTFYSLSVLIALVSPLSPAGLGVKEGLIIISLSEICTPNILIVALIISRFSSIFSDIILFLFAKYKLRD